MAFGAFDQTKEQIMNDVLYILDFIRKDRSFLNKHFQNSINNYFLEDYAGNFLKEYLNMPRAKDITKFIQNKYMDLKGTKYMKLMSGYIQELKESNQINLFQNLLLSNTQSESYDNDKQSKEWQSNVWKRAFSLFVFHFCQKENESLKGIFEIWNSLFPRSKILRKRQENVNHRPREFQESEINNVRQVSKMNQNNETLTAEQYQAIQNMDQQLFGNEFKSNVFYPNQKNQCHLKQQVEYYVAPQIQNQQPIQSFAGILNNQIFEDSVAEPQIDFNQPQQDQSIFDFFTNIPEDTCNNQSASSSPVSSAPQTMTNLVQFEQQDQVNEQITLTRNNSYQYLQHLNQSNQLMNQQFVNVNSLFFQQENDNEEYFNLKFFTNTCNVEEQYNIFDMNLSYSFTQQAYQNNNNYC